MPTYDYYCAANRKTVEVEHSIHVKLESWQEVCEAAGVKLGKTAPDAPVERVPSMISVHTPGGGRRRQEALKKASRIMAETPAPPTSYDATGHGCYGHSCGGDDH